MYTCMGEYKDRQITKESAMGGHGEESGAWGCKRLEGVPPALGLCLESALDSRLVLGCLYRVESSIEDNDTLSSHQDSDDGQGDRDEDETSAKLV